MIAKRNKLKFRPLDFYSSLHLTAAASWLTLGQIEESATEVSSLSARRSHPQAVAVRPQLSDSCSASGEDLPKGGIS